MCHDCRSQWPRGLRRGSAATRFESQRRHEYLYLVSVVFCEVEVEPTFLEILLVTGNIVGDGDDGEDMTDRSYRK